MKIDWLKIGLSFILVILLQVFFFDDFYLYGFINPMIYVIFIMLTSFKISRAFFYLLSFALGLSIDIFHGTGGIHAAASLLIAALRYPILFYITGKRLGNLDLYVLDFPLYVLAFYSALLILIHHFTIYSLDYFKIEALGKVMYAMLTTGLFTFIIVFLLLIILKFNKYNE